jgi:hypothetical protein
MKKLMCKDLGGACDTLISGNTPDEMGENCKVHAMLLIKQGDKDHLEAMEKMRHMSPGEFAVFWADFRKMFEEAEEGS